MAVHGGGIDARISAGCGSDVMWATLINGACRHTPVAHRGGTKPQCGGHRKAVPQCIYKGARGRAYDSSQVNTSELHLARANCLINDNRASGHAARTRAPNAASILVRTRNLPAYARTTP